MELGYALSSEEHGPLDLIENAKLAEAAGFPYALISDHFHPWSSRQPHSPFVWSTLGGLALATQKLRIGTGVTCPIRRTHPAIIAQAAATTAAMLPKRFFLGLGTGEDLNEHIVGERWPPLPQRLEMLAEAIHMIKELWKGDMTTIYGQHFKLEDARIFTLPEELPPIAIAAGGDKAGALAGRLGDALISTAPKKEIVAAFRRAGGEGKPCYGQVAVCWAENEAEAKKTALQWWPNAGLPKPLSQELRSVEHFDAAAEDLTAEDVAKKVVCGPDVARYVEAVKEYTDAGFDQVYIHQVGPDQAGFIKFYEDKLRKALQ